MSMEKNSTSHLTKILHHVEDSEGIASLLRRIEDEPHSFEEILRECVQLNLQPDAEDLVKGTLKVILMLVCGTEDVEQRFKEWSEQGIIRSNVCGTLWNEGDAAYKCNTCELDSSCAICLDCFSQGNHTGHDYKLIKVSGGVCDCGDFQSWKPTGFCSKHRGNVETEEHTFENVPSSLVAKLTFAIRQVLILLNGLISSATDKSLEIVMWLETLCKRGDLFRRALAGEWTHIGEDGHTLLDEIMRVHPNLPEKLTEQLHNLFFPLLFVSFFRKRFLQRHFIPYYSKHVEEHIINGADEKDMLADFPVQLFTVANCTSIFKSEKMLEIIVEKLATILSLCKGDESIDLESDIISNRNYTRLTTDMGYLLSHRDMAYYFILQEDGELFARWCRVLHYLQGMDTTIVRVTTEHVEWDKDSWIYAFALELEVMTILPQILAGISHTEVEGTLSLWPQHYQRLVSSCFATLLDWLKHTFGTFSSLPVEFKVSSDSITFHIPLHRYLSGLLYQGVKLYKVTLDDLLVVDDRQLLAKYLIEHPLRIQVLVSQVRSEMWNRNGKEVWASCSSYESVHFRDFFKELDLFLLQCGVVLLGATEFIKICIQRFELAWFQNRDNQEPSVDMKKMTEEFLRFIIIMACHRAMSGASDEATIRRELIHRLCIDGHTHSQLTENIDPRLVEHPSFEKILKEVSVFQQPKQMEQGTYQLRQECFNEFDRYFPHYTKMEAEEAEDRYQKYMKSHSSSKNLFSVQPSLQLQSSLTFPAFESLRLLLQSDVLHKGIFLLLYEALKGMSFTSDSLINDVLHVLFIAIKLYVQPDLEGLSRTTAPSPSASNERPSPVKRKATHFTGNISELEFPSSFNLPKNARFEVPISESRSESILSMLVKLPAAVLELAHHADKIQAILALFIEQDRTCKHYIDKLNAKENALKQAPSVSSSAQDEDEQERKKRRRERQAAIMSKFNQEMASFSALNTPEDESSAEKQEDFNPFPEIQSCALCREQASIFTRPIGLVSFAQPSNILELSKTKHQLKEALVDTEVAAPTSRRGREYSAFEENGLDSADFYDFPPDRDVDRVTRALRFMTEQMEDSEFDGMEDVGEPFLGFGNEFPSEEEDEEDSEDLEENHSEASEDEDEEMAEENQDETGTLSPTETSNKSNDEEEESDEEEEAKANMDFIASELKALEQLLLWLGQHPEQIRNWWLRLDRRIECVEREIEFLEDAHSGSSKTEKPTQFHAQLKDLRALAPPLFDLMQGTFLNLQSCNNHVIHFDCLERYLESLLQSRSGGNEYEGEHLIDLERREFLCVVCRRLSNHLIPIVPLLLSHNESQLPAFREWAQQLSKRFSETFEKCSNFPLPGHGNSVESFALQILNVHFQSRLPTDLAQDPALAAEVLWSAFGLSIGSCEIASRNEKSGLFELPDSSVLRLKALFYSGLAYRHHKVSALAPQQHTLCQILSGQFENQELLFLDPFSLLTQLLFLWPKPATLPSELCYFAQYCYYLRCLQILLRICVDPEEGKLFSPDLSRCLRSVLLEEKGTPEDLPFTTADLLHLKARILAFLRQTALVQFACFGKVPPSSLPENTMESMPSSSDDVSILCGYLRLPVFEDAIRKQLWVTGLPQMWMRSALKHHSKDLLPQVLPANTAFAPFSLVPLPHLYYDLLQKFSKAKCTVCKTAPSMPAICLVCGTLVCVNSPCCRTMTDGECSDHMFKCSGRIGLFLVLKLSTVLVLRESRHSFWGSPYLDEHGEEDVHLTRGKPLYLNEERYNQLTQLFVSGRLEYDSVIAESILEETENF